MAFGLVGTNGICSNLPAFVVNAPIVSVRFPVALRFRVRNVAMVRVHHGGGVKHGW